MTHAQLAHALIDSPVGVLTLVETGGGLAGLYLADQRHLPGTAGFGPRDDTALPGLQEQLGAYFAGDLHDFDVTLSTTGTPFQQQVWAALRDVAYGTTCTYADLAVAIGRPTAVRAVGAANGRNPVSIVVPCHRVVGSGGALTGYAGGLERKHFLLQHELQHSALLR